MSDGRIESCEYTRVGEHARLRQPVEKSGLPGIGVSGQSECEERHGLTLPTLHSARAAHGFQVAFEPLDALVNAAPVGFKLGFAGASRTDTAAQPGHGNTLPGQPGQQVIELRQFDLKLTFSRPRP